ncbi:protein PLASTID MOVEMENT IMPAIRED 1-RELATED 2 isoform X1 [Syzygium oleosum]|uniref:protein PLASTID MOVEMENT IMPAIRED 1-RELATED 2 isoform X1 n=1 Tax=Syzygium oleosum TaxID=219896 RepID=UPI0024BB8E70|nr:protein PLASTID MOVEMENT IMPAIRED 1-RELATED 2 isoform X1 [Syzygium oleosum]
MLVSGQESGNGASSMSASNSQLLHDIEAISRALYLHEATQKPLISPSTECPGKVGCVKHRLVAEPGNRDDKGSNKFNKSLSMWNWKKPLKALSHLRGQKFGCLFFLHVHSIEGLPVNFDGVGFCVEFKRKDEVLKSRPSRVLRGTADFDDTLMHRCTVYCHKSGPLNSCKYEPKLFSVHTYVIGTPGFDVGEHWVDLTRLLPLTWEELDGDESSGKWTTSFKLAGKAKGATLNVSFGFSLVSRANLESHGNMTVSELKNLAYSRPNTEQHDRGFPQNCSTEKLRRSGSVPSDLNHPSLQFAQPLDVKMGHDAFVDPAIEFSKSIHYLYEKLDQDILSDKSGSDLSSENLKSLKAKSDLCPEPVREPIDDEGDDMDFVVIDQGIEVPQSKQLNPVQVSIHTQDSATETLNKDETLICDLLYLDEMKCDLVDHLTGSTTAGLVIGDNKIGELSVHAKRSALEVESTFLDALILDSADLGSLPASGHSKRKENYMELKYSYKANKKGTQSLSCDDISEFVTSDFLHMLESEHSLSGSNFNGEPESPREQLLREFEREAFLSGNFILGFNATEEWARFGCGASVGSSSEDNSEDSILASVLQDAEEEYERSSQSLRHRRKIKMLEDLETEILMREWGLDEKAFQNSPRCPSGGFGSPIELPPQEPVESPLLGEGFGPSIQTGGGGFLRTIIPSLFRNAKNGMNLILQVSRPVVLPARMGSSNMKVLQHLASIEIEKLSKQIDKAVPLKNITGTTLQQVACEAAPKTIRRQALLQHETASSQNSKEQECTLSCNNPVSDLVSLEDIVLLAMDKIEALTIEGLRTQCGMTDEEAPSSIIPHFEMPASQRMYANFHELMSLEDDEFHLYDVQNSDSDAYGLMDFSVTLDDWLRLDAGVSIGNLDETGESTRKILVAHHAKCEDSSREKLIEDIHPGEASGMRSGLLRNNLTVAFRVQLRDPLRNFEAVGDPMLALVHVERRYVHQDVSERRNEDEDGGMPTRDGMAISSFRIIELHLAGVDSEPGKKQSWGTTRQRQLGARWLFASGLGKATKQPLAKKATKQPLAKSKAAVKSLLGVKTKGPHADVLWSISPCPHGIESNSKKSERRTTHVRNPDVIFLNESSRSASCI